MRTLTLTEYRTRESPVALTVEERDLLHRLVPSMLIAPASGATGSYYLTPGSIVGAVQLGDLAIEIRPKITIDQLLFLLAYSMNPKDWKQQPFAYHAGDLVEAIIPAFVTHTRRALQRGPLQAYRLEEDSLHTVRGRLRFDDQIRRRFGLIPPIEVRFDEFTDDVEENRLIKSALNRLRKLCIRSADNRRSLHSFDAKLELVADINYEPRHLPDITFTRLNDHYRPAIQLAQLILRSAAFHLDHGNVTGTSVLFDMNKVFEDFVVVALREALHLNDRSFPQGAAGHRLTLDHAGVVRLKPDLSWWEHGLCRFVGDVKYKRVNVAGIEHPDLYQLLAYLIATNLNAGLLVYAAGEGEATVHETVNLGRSLHVRTLDLAGSPAHVLQQIQVLAEEVRAIAYRGDGAAFAA